jgi:hypothetical protein
MNVKLFALAIGVATLSACATTTAPTPRTSWGKEGVSMLDYRTDGGQCAVLAATANPDANGANTAGGINGRNSGGTALPTVQGGPTGTSGSSGSVYRENASPDFVNRAAIQQRSQDMAKDKARKEALSSCLVERGYTEFRLTSKERAQLAALPEGSEERRQFLFGLATNPEVLKNAMTR